MPHYTVISDRFLTGTISSLPAASRLAWLVVLFEADRLGGRVKMPVWDLAKKASISPAEAADALRAFLEPDAFSSSDECEGRRLLAVEGEKDWYDLVTWEKHAKERETYFARLRQQRHRRRQAKVDGGAAADEEDAEEDVTADRDKSPNVTVNRDEEAECHGSSRSVTKEPEPELETTKSKEMPTTEVVGERQPVSKGTRGERRRRDFPYDLCDEIFERCWALVPRKHGRKDARRHFDAEVNRVTASLREPAEIEDALGRLEQQLVVAFKNYTIQIRSEGTAPRFVMHGSRLLYNFRDYLAPAKPQPPSTFIAFGSK
jgi:hypothetical protein